MSKCKLPTVAVNRLTEEQCDRMMAKAKRNLEYCRDKYISHPSPHYIQNGLAMLRIYNRLLTYKNNLKNR